MTTFLHVSAVLAVGILARHVAVMAVAYLALRHSPPEKRSEILRALGPVLTAVRPSNQRNAR